MPSTPLAPIAAAFFLAAALPSQAPKVRIDPSSRKPDASDAFFDRGPILKLKIEIAPADLARLKENPRDYVPANLRENDRTVYEGVGVKLKGAAGSFREIDDRPGFTIAVDKYAVDARFYGLDKFHLNNAVQDDTWLHERLASEIATAAKIPATRATHARVFLGDKDLGLYVLKESFDRRFLARHFVKSNGALYDGGFCQDVDADLEKDVGRDKKDRGDLKALVDACRDPEPAKRWPRIEEKLDIDAFLTFVAFETMIGHWDGYALNRNNYRVYFEPIQGKAWFLPHGMDQVFVDPEASILEYPTAIVAEAVMRNPDWRARYRKKINDLLPFFAAKERLVPRIEALRNKLEPTLKEIDAAAAGRHAGAVRALRDRVVARDLSLKEQAKSPEPKSLDFGTRGFAKLQGFKPATEHGAADHEQKEEGRKRALSVSCKGDDGAIASWRKKVTLARGSYVLEASVLLRDHVARGEEPSGAFVRVDAAPPKDGVGAASAEWAPLTFAFDVAEDRRQVEIVLEYRAAAGRAAFDLSSIRIVKRP
jgi:spore coat protein H